MSNRKDGMYLVKYKGNWVEAKWVTNQDIDSSWCCWIIDGIQPPKDSWGFTDSDFEEINENELKSKSDPNDLPNSVGGGYGFKGILGC